jgi:hypothetical protein
VLRRLSTDEDVLIAQGPFIGRIAIISEAKDETAVVTLTVFDRAVPLELPCSHLLPPPESGSGGVGEPRDPHQPSGSPGVTSNDR